MTSNIVLMLYVKFLSLEADHPIADAQAYLGTYQISTMEFFMKIVNSFN